MNTIVKDFIESIKIPETSKDFEDIVSMKEKRNENDVSIDEIDFKYFDLNFENIKIPTSSEEFEEMMKI